MFSKSFLSIKKNFDQTLEQALLGDNGNSSYTSDEETPAKPNENTLRIVYEDQELELPNDILQLEDLHSLFTTENIKEMFSLEEQKNLFSLLPESENPQELLKWLFSDILRNPMDEFLQKAQWGNFSHQKQQRIRLQKQLYHHEIIEHFEGMLEELKGKLEDSNKNKQFLFKRKNSQFLEDLFTEESDREKHSLSGLSIENSFSELSQGYSTPISISEEPIIHSFAKRNNDISIALQENRILEARKTMIDSGKNKRPPINETESLNSQKMPLKNHTSSTGISTKPVSSLSGGTNNQKKTNGKSGTTKEWIENYRAQEAERYANPLRPFTYLCQDGNKGIVAPVSKKISFAPATKPRDHFLLKNERPPYITILCLVRDAACRLPNGFGTRADICELLKESQYINENVPDDKLSNIVSGALDRLHYEDDACVKYDPEKKLWIYLHRGRTENYSAWAEQNDARSSKKKEYNQKYKNRKRVRVDENKPGHK